MPKAEPHCSAKRRPKWRANAPSGSVPNHMPNTMAVIGKVASPLSGASTAPTMLAVLDDDGVVAAGQRLRDRQHHGVATGQLSSGLACWKGFGDRRHGRAPGKPPLVAVIRRIANAGRAEQY